MGEKRTRLDEILEQSVTLDVSWLFLFVLIAWALATSYFPAELAGRSVPQYWAMAVAAVILLLASALLHELGHSAASLYLRVPVRRIRLFVFGGLAAIGSQPPNAQADFSIAVAGPAVNLALAAIFVTLELAEPAGRTIEVMARYAALVNGGLGLFNLVPGLPLDGGRILRAIVWGATDDLYRAIRVASWSGRAIALAPVLGGAWLAARGNIADGLWLVLLGLFIFFAAGLYLERLRRLDLLDGHQVKEAMRRQYSVVPPNRNLEQLVRDEVLSRGQRVFVINAGGRLAGLLTLPDLEGIPRDSWSSLLVREVMTCTDSLQHVGPETTLRTALEEMDGRGANELPVMAGGELQGVLARHDVMRLWNELTADAADHNRKSSRRRS